MKYKVREHFYVHMNGQVFEPGTVLDLTEEQAERHAAQLEEAQEAPSPTKRRKASSNDSL